MYYLISILFGLIPEVLYFTLFITYTKNIKEKRLILFILISIVYFFCMLIQQYKLIYYLLFVVLVYFSLKILYKKKIQIIAIFIISLAETIILFLSYFCFLCIKKDLSNYYLFYAIDRILLFSIFIFRNKFNVIYKKYCKLWNRNDKEKRPIKSITLRNISLILMNLVIAFMNLYLLMIS